LSFVTDKKIIKEIYITSEGRGFRRFIIIPFENLEGLSVIFFVELCILRSGSSMTVKSLDFILFLEDYYNEK
jgi:hypothetical protein